MSEAPPPYDENKSTMYPNPSAGPDYTTATSYQPNMANPYPAPNHSAHGASYAQHGAGMPPPTPQPTYVYVNDIANFGSRQMSMQCPHCHQQVITKVRHSAGLLAWILFGVFILFGCWFGCCLIPFCLESCQDCEHYCSNCNNFLGLYKRL
ncbi:LITAF-like zinc ribbon domain-containing protein [Ditylenchus destructor]|nr:LITAF-like zinc ribbon domain-containing protein [Ditylenchus destructor]